MKGRKRDKGRGELRVAGVWACERAGEWAVHKAEPEYRKMPPKVFKALDGIALLI